MLLPHFLRECWRRLWLHFRPESRRRLVLVDGAVRCLLSLRRRERDSWNINKPSIWEEAEILSWSSKMTLNDGLG